MSCSGISQLGLNVTRGNPFVLDVGLSSSYPDVIADPAEYVLRLSFRDAQDDTLPILLEITSTIELNDTPVPPGEYPIYGQFRATVAQTAALPEWDIVAYCELDRVSGSAGIYPQRLFNADVQISD